MSAPAEVLARLESAGVNLTLAGRDLVAGPREALTDGLRNLIRSNKPALVRFLSDRLANGPEETDQHHPNPPDPTATDHADTAATVEKPALVEALTLGRHVWDIREPTGAHWRSFVAPPQTVAKVLAAYPPGTTAVPVADPDPGTDLPEDVERLVNAYLDRINETDPQARAEALQLARARPSVRAIYREPWPSR